MKRINILPLIFCFFGIVSMFGQTEIRKAIKPMDEVADDYLSLLKSSGYRAFPFDISSLSDGQYALTLIIQEYKDGKKIHDDIYGGAIGIDVKPIKMLN